MHGGGWSVARRPPFTPIGILPTAAKRRLADEAAGAIIILGAYTIAALLR
jgi:hypothetical protein